VQERVDRDRHYPWRVLVCCALLNRTTGAQVRPMVGRLFALCPTPAALLVCPDRHLLPLLVPLGLYNRRLALLRRLTLDWAEGKPPQQCHGVGQYALDAWALFVEGRTDVEPADHFLKPYLEWRKNHGNKIEWARPQAGAVQAAQVLLREEG
jgi:methyl-CpG-binding domain protein 4